MALVLVVDDHANMRRSMALVLSQDGHEVFEAANASDAVEVIQRHKVNVIVSDVRLNAQSNGVDVLRQAKQHRPGVEVVLITAFGTIDDAVDAMRDGAYDYLTKPADPQRLMITVRRAAERETLAREVKELRAQVAGGNDIVACSATMQDVLAQVRQVARNSSTVLVCGESGTGKELVARMLHSESSRAGAKFVPINCGAIVETILESELFGYRKGAFTGAVGDKKGLLEEADRGVLFLDEIGEMAPAMQVRLLRFLEGGEVRRVGDTKTTTVDVRLVAATHRDLEAEVAEGRFRQDFYYRINVVTIVLPPLRERRADVPPLANYFLSRIGAKINRRVQSFSPNAMALMCAYDWPGNVRELQNAIERALNVASGSDITEADLPAAVTVGVSSRVSPAGSGEERAALLGLLQDCRWNQGRAAARLGISRTTLWRKLKEHRIPAR